VLSEQGIKYNEYGADDSARNLGNGYLEFTAIGKAVTLTEYGNCNMASLCFNSTSIGFNTICKETSLTAKRKACCGSAPCTNPQA
jgi:hypothetical protein